LVAPAIYITVSIVTQLLCVVLGMLLVWRMDMAASELILANLDLPTLFIGQISGWLLTMLWVAPAYAWLLLVSAAARRSPFMLAVAPVLGLIILEAIFLGTGYVRSAVINHVPHYIGGGSAVGFYMDGPDWLSLNFVSMLAGLAFAAVAVTAAVYLRRYRFQI
jgi:ABC-2 type transport system permease protein